MASWDSNRYMAALRDKSNATCYLYNTNFSNSPYAIGMQMTAYNSTGALVSVGACCGSYTAATWCSNSTACGALNVSWVCSGTALVGTWMALADIPAGWVGPIVRVK